MELGGVGAGAEVAGLGVVVVLPPLTAALRVSMLAGVDDRLLWLVDGRLKKFSFLNNVTCADKKYNEQSQYKWQALTTLSVKIRLLFHEYCILKVFKMCGTTILSFEKVREKKLRFSILV